MGFCFLVDKQLCHCGVPEPRGPTGSCSSCLSPSLTLLFLWKERRHRDSGPRVAHLHPPICSPSWSAAAQPGSGLDGSPHWEDSTDGSCLPSVCTGTLQCHVSTLLFSTASCMMGHGPSLSSTLAGYKYSTSLFVGGLCVCLSIAIHIERHERIAIF